MNNYGTRLAADFIYGRLNEGLWLLTKSEEVGLSLYNYSSGNGREYTYSPEWYNSYEYARWHKHYLYNWFLDSTAGATRTPTGESALICAQVFVGSPIASDPGAAEAALSALRFTFARHYLRACFQYTADGTIKAHFVVKDRFDFDSTLCTPQTGISGVLGFGCIPNEWWVTAAQKGHFGGPFDQHIEWTEEISLPSGRFSTPLVLKPGCTTTEAGFCPLVNRISDLNYKP